jgi:AcrR family transcriptional regulator
MAEPGGTQLPAPLAGANGDDTTHGNQRSRILAAALDLMATHGAGGMTMRQLASACDLTIATLYHYFGSKSELLGAVIDERDYDAALRHASLPVDVTLAPRARLEQLLEVFWTGTLGEAHVWRLLIGESLRSDEVALDAVRRLASGLEQAVERWLSELFPELPADRADATSVVVGQLLAFFLEELLLPEADRSPRMRRRAAATAAVLFPEPADPGGWTARRTATT